jgi:tetratricopeptide (TPR) repeat protein
MTSRPRVRQRDRADPLHRTLADLLVALRTEADLSQRKLAKLIDFSRDSVASAENCHRVMSEQFWTACDQELAAGGRLQTAYRQLRHHRRDDRRRQAVTGRQTAATEGRRALAGGLPYDAVGADGAPIWPEHESGVRLVVASGQGPRPTPRLVDEDLDPITRRYRSLYHHLPSDELLPAVAGHLQLTERLLGRADDRTRRTLASTVAEVAGFTAWLYGDLGDLARMQRLYRMADAAVEVSGERGLAAYVRGFFAVRLIERDELLRGRDQLDAARRQAGRQPPQLLRSWLAAITADVQSRLGHGAEATRALDRAESALHNAHEAPAPEWMFGFDRARLLAYAGGCYRRLDQPARAIAALDEALEALSSDCGRRRAEVVLELARSQLLGGQAEEARRLAGVAAEAFADWRSAAGLDQVGRFCRTLTTAGQPGAAESLREQLLALTGPRPPAS